MKRLAWCFFPLLFGAIWLAEGFSAMKTGELTVMRGAWVSSGQFLFAGTLASLLGISLLPGGIKAASSEIRRFPRKIRDFFRSIVNKERLRSRRD